jgi:mono/diheme cytochrome c family protein
MERTMAHAQRTTRRWLIVLGALWLLFFGAVAWALLSGGTGLAGLFGQDEATAQAEGAADEGAAENDSADADGADAGGADADGAAPTDSAAGDPDETEADGDGWFTAEQASRGGASYAEHCARCHGDDLAGGVGPPLAGGTFWTRWGGDSVHTLFEVTRQTMPQDAPNSLPADTYADIVAHVLDVNGFPRGSAELPAEAGRLQELALDRSLADRAEGAGDGPASDDDGASGRANGAGEPAEGRDDDAEAAAAPEAGPQEGAATPEDAPAAAAGADPAGPAGDRAAADPATDRSRPAAVGDADWFSEAQVAAGGGVFAEHCARCHGAQLQGNPPLVGGAFPTRYANVWELYQYVRQTMPQDAPGSLDDRSYLESVAYVLHANGYPVGDQRLAPLRSQLASLRLDAELAGPVRIGGDEAGASEGDPSDTDATDADAEAADADGDAAAAADPGADADADGANEDGSGEGAEGSADGAFSEEQAERGAEAFAQHCAACHGDDLQGDPPLVGDAFLANHGTVGALFDTTRQTMPQDAPGSLDDDTYADIIAHVLAQNDFEPGDEELDPDDRAALDDLALEGTSDGGGADDQGDAPTGEGDADATTDAEAGADADAATEGDAPAEGPADAATAEGPAPGQAWLDVATRPERATINVVGPDGFVGRASGAQTLRDLVPGRYLIAASLGHENETATVVLGSGDHARVELVLWDLAQADDVGGPTMVTEVPAIPLRPAEALALGDWGSTDGTAAASAPAGEDAPAAAAPEGDARPDADAPAEDDPSSPAAERAPWGPQAANGERAYALHCARCHGAQLQGHVAPPLAGEVFFERWAGHPVDWLYFQARASMPPHGPGFLSEQTTTDILVYTLAEAGVLEGFERFQPHDEAFRRLTIVRTQLVEDAEAGRLEARIDDLRGALHAPHAEGAAAPLGVVPSIEWPDDPGVAPIGDPAWIPAEARALPAEDLAEPDAEATEPEAPTPADEDGDGEEDEGEEDDDDGDDDEEGDDAPEDTDEEGGA